MSIIRKNRKNRTVKRIRARLPRVSLRSWLWRWQEWASLLLLVLTLGIAVRSIEDAGWISPQPALTLILVLSVFACFVLVKSHLPAWATAPIGIIIAAAVLAWQALSLLPSWATSGTLISSLRTLWLEISSGKPSENTLFFGLFIIICIWIIGYVSTWFVLRKQNAWVAVSLGAAAIMINLNNLSDTSYSTFFYYLLAAMMLVAFVSLMKRHLPFIRLRLKYSWRAVAWFVSAALCLSLFMLIVTWFAPEIRASELETLVSTKMPRGKDIESYWANLFAAVPSKTSIVRSSHQETLNFTSPLNLSTEVQFVVTAPRQPTYLRTRRFDIYNAWGWSATAASEQMLNGNTPISVSDLSASTSEMTYTVVNKIKTDVLLTAGELVSASMPVLMYKLIPAEANTPRGKDAAFPLLTSVFQGTGNPMAITATRLLNANDSYRIAAVLNSATPAELTRAAQSYPRSITDFYLQLPSSLPLRVRQTSQLIVNRAQARTPYDKAIAIKSYLSRLAYIEAGTAPPGGTDGVDYFISVQRTGNCTNFASAMVVMLRASGVPARFAAGYLPRDWDEKTKTINIRAKDYHAWAEVYFPGYGWIEFEATPLPSPDAVSGAGVDDSVDGTAVDTSSALDSAISERSWTGLLLIMLGVVLFAFIVVMMVRRQLRHLTPAQRASELYARMCLYASLLRLRPRLGQTPLEYSYELTEAFPSQAEPIGDITQAYIRATFSQSKELDEHARKVLDRSWHSISRAFLKRLLRVRR